jgi:TRAP-type C4-dicarboxylate transport system permease small subunit
LTFYRRKTMNRVKVIAVVLMVAGVLALVYGGFTYTSQTHRATIGSMELAVQEKNTVNVPIWAGVALVAAGGGMILVGKKRRRA